jgi:hypothetical protein
MRYWRDSKLPVTIDCNGSNPEVRRRMPTDPAVSRPNSTSILTVQYNGAVVRPSSYTNPIYFSRGTAVLYRRNFGVYFSLGVNRKEGMNNDTRKS